MPISTIPLASAVNGALPAANAPSGSVIQTVTSTITGDISTTSTSAVSVGLYATITPKFTTSKILVLFGTSCALLGNSSNNGIKVEVRRGTSGAGSGSAIGGVPFYWQVPQVGGSNTYTNGSNFVIDSPASTSALTYTIFHYSTAGQNVGFCWGFTANNMATITLMEIAA